MRIIILAKILLLISFCQLAFAQFAPQVGLPGTTAIHRDSTIIISWAPNCMVTRGWKDISDQLLGYVSSGDESKGTGKADAEIVSLGDGGEAIFFFENPIVNGSGYDFAIFENGFPDPLDPSMAYLELATVSVSNDGIQYFPFSAISNSDTLVQNAGDYMNASNIHNLAGKYIQYYGTPFDLDELSMILSLDVNNIRYIKVKDVIGSLNNNICSRDINQHKINDPFPTPYTTGGFDLDALAILHQKFPVGLQNTSVNTLITVYPNPSKGIYYFHTEEKILAVDIISWEGQVITSMKTRNNEINLSNLVAGNYHLCVKLESGEVRHLIITKL